jgi:hypothetical protein
MKKVVASLVVLGMAMVGGLTLLAQEQNDLQKITVKNRESNNGVVILAVQDGKSSFELQCNKGASGCTALDPGEYMMLRLPKNQGMYDCTNAEIYRKGANAQSGERLGQYCLIETK